MITYQKDIKLADKWLILAVKNFETKKLKIQNRHEEDELRYVKIALKHGANPNLIDSEIGLTVLQMAILKNHDELVNLLLKTGADINSVSYNFEACIEYISKSKLTNKKEIMTNFLNNRRILSKELLERYVAICCLQNNNTSFKEEDFALIAHYVSRLCGVNISGYLNNFKDNTEKNSPSEILIMSIFSLFELLVKIQKNIITIAQEKEKIKEAFYQEVVMKTEAFKLMQLTDAIENAINLNEEEKNNLFETLADNFIFNLHIHARKNFFFAGEKEDKIFCHSFRFINGKFFIYDKILDFGFEKIKDEIFCSASNEKKPLIAIIEDSSFKEHIVYLFKSQKNSSRKDKIQRSSSFEFTDFEDKLTPNNAKKQECIYLETNKDFFNWPEKETFSDMQMRIEGTKIAHDKNFWKTEAQVELKESRFKVYFPSEILTEMLQLLKKGLDFSNESIIEDEDEEKTELEDEKNDKKILRLINIFLQYKTINDLHELQKRVLQFIPDSEENASRLNLLKGMLNINIAFLETSGIERYVYFSRAASCFLKDLEFIKDSILILKKNYCLANCYFFLKNYDSARSEFQKCAKKVALLKSYSNQDKSGLQQFSNKIKAELENCILSEEVQKSNCSPIKKRKEFDNKFSQSRKLLEVGTFKKSKSNENLTPNINNKNIPPSFFSPY